MSRAIDATTPCYPVSRAELIARVLMRTHGPLALDHARHRHARAKLHGHHRQIDFYTAVCAIIADRGQAYSRSRAAG